MRVDFLRLMRNRIIFVKKLHFLSLLTCWIRVKIEFFQLQVIKRLLFHEFHILLMQCWWMRRRCVNITCIRPFFFTSWYLNFNWGHNIFNISIYIALNRLLAFDFMKGFLLFTKQFYLHCILIISGVYTFSIIDSILIDASIWL